MRNLEKDIFLNRQIIDISELEDIFKNILNEYIFSVQYFNIILHQLSLQIQRQCNILDNNIIIYNIISIILYKYMDKYSGSIQKNINIDTVALSLLTKSLN